MVTTEPCQYILQQGVIRMGILDLGATLSFLEMPDRFGEVRNVVAGFRQPADYGDNEYYFGCVIGRYANRIGGGRFRLDGAEVQLSVNNGRNHLHGGKEGLHQKRWIVRERLEWEGASGLVLECLSAAGEDGYPGNCVFRVTYLLDESGRLSINYHATTDAATPLSLTNHSYFNLSGFDNPVIGDHLLRIHAKTYTEKNGENLPTGRLLSVSNTPLDFTVFQRIGDRIGRLTLDHGYDHNFVLDNKGELSIAAELEDPLSGRRLRVLTDQPGIQAYTANWWDGHLTGPQGVPYIQHGAIALETQAFPDSPNHPEFPNTILRPGENYQTMTIFEFCTK